jgi:hypothetical protein
MDTPGPIIPNSLALDVEKGKMRRVEKLASIQIELNALLENKKKKISVDKTRRYSQRRWNGNCWQSRSSRRE